jgi:ketosteroid isomerase-like protein
MGDRRTMEAAADRNIDLVREGYEAFSRGRMEVSAACFTQK